MSVGIEWALTTCRTECAEIRLRVALAGRGGWAGMPGCRSIGSIPHPHATSFRPLVAKTTAPTFVATKWRVCPFCFLGWHHRNDSQAARVASLRNLNWEALQHASVRGMYGIRATGCRCAKSWRLARPEQIARMNKKEGHYAADKTSSPAVRWGSGGSAR